MLPDLRGGLCLVHPGCCGLFPSELYRGRGPRCRKRDLPEAVWLGGEGKAQATFLLSVPLLGLLRACLLFLQGHSDLLAGGAYVTSILQL